jgi:hypothetical protein
MIDVAEQQVDEIDEVSHEIEEIHPDDIAMGDDFRMANESDQENTGYPFNLTEEQIVRMIFFYGARRLASKALKTGMKTESFTSTERTALRQFFDWFGFVSDTPENFKKAYGALNLKFKAILGFLKIRPAFISADIYKALNVAGYSNITKQMVFVVDKNNKVVPRLIQSDAQKYSSPLANLDKLQWELQGIAMDKMMMILQNITISDIKKANLGSKSKALRDIYAMYHMAKLGNKNPNTALVSINVNSAEPQDKLKSYTQYIIKNRES